MILRVPDYYEEFACIAGACTGSCCDGWEIDIDDASREYYSSVGGEIGERLREKLYQGEDGEYRFTDGHTWAEACADENNQLVTVFKDGNMVKEQTLAEIREVLHNGNF